MSKFQHSTMQKQRGKKNPTIHRHSKILRIKQYLKTQTNLKSSLSIQIMPNHNIPLLTVPF